MSNYDIIKVQRVRFSVESTFGVDRTADVASNFFDVRHLPTQLMRKATFVEDESAVQRMWQRNHDVHGPDRWEMSLTSHWVGTGNALNTAATSTKTGQNKVLEQLLGGYYDAAGSDVVASPSPTTTGASVTTGQGSRFREGQLAGIALGGGTTIYPVLITGVSTDALTWWPALPSAPSTGDDVLNSQTVYMTDRPAGSLQVLAEAAINRGNIWLGKGSQGDFALDLSFGANAKWTTKLTGCRYDHDDELTTPQGGSAIAAATYDGTGPIVSFEGGLHFGPSGATTRSMIRGEVSFNFDRKWQEIVDFSATGNDGLGQYHVDRGRPMVEITTPWSSDTEEAYDDAMQAETEYGVLAWLGTTGGYVRAACAPTLQIVGIEPTEWRGTQALKISCLMLENGHSGSKSTEIKRSPVVLGHI